MKLLNLRNELKSLFSQNQIDVSDVDFIIAEVLAVSRTDLVLIEDVDEDKVKIIKEKADLRLNSMPIEKIFNKAYFYGSEFWVDENVLSPRPETEILVEEALAEIKENSYNSVLDLCTGSGCIAVSIKKNSDAIVTASDISLKALEIAKRNAEKNNAAIKFIHSDMFENIKDKFDLIVSNPPYIDTQEVQLLDKEVKDYDPYIALDGGDLGLKFYNIIHDNIKKVLNNNGTLILEIGEDQREMLEALFNDFKFIECLKDYSGNDRVLILKK